MSRLTRDGLLPNPSPETKFSGASGDREIFIFPIQLITSRIGNLTWFILTLAICDHGLDFDISLYANYIDQLREYFIRYRAEMLQSSHYLYGSSQMLSFSRLAYNFVLQMALKYVRISSRFGSETTFF